MEHLTVHVIHHLAPELAHLLGHDQAEKPSTEPQETHHDQAEQEQATNSTTRRGVSQPHPGATGRTVPRARPGETRGIVLACLRKLHPKAATAKPIARRLGITISAVTWHFRQLREQGRAEPCGKVGKSMTWRATRPQP